MWWAASSLLTVGYGDIYPITTLGKIFGIFITFLGVGVVAIPTGIISAGFVEQYADMKKATYVGREKDMNFIQVPIRDLDISRHSVIVLVKRKNKVRIPNGNLVLKEWDCIFMYTQKYVVDAKDIEV